MLLGRAYRQDNSPAGLKINLDLLPGLQLKLHSRSFRRGLTSPSTRQSDTSMLTCRGTPRIDGFRFAVRYDRGLLLWLRTPKPMKPAVFLFCMMALSVGGCSWIPRAGPSTSDVLEQGQAGGEILFDVVQVDDRVVDALIAQPKERFALRFKKDAQPPEVKIAIGDTVSVMIWESAAGGLFSETPPAPAPTGGRSGIEPLTPESQPPPGERGTLAPTPGAA